MENTPRKIVLVEKVHHYIHDALNIVSSRLIITATRIKTREEEVARKLLDVLFGLMPAILFEIFAREAEVD